MKTFEFEGKEYGIPAEFNDPCPVERRHSECCKRGATGGCNDIPCMNCMFCDRPDIGAFLAWEKESK